MVKEHQRRILRVVSPPKSFFKELFIRNTKLAVTLKTMSDQHGILKGLRDQECKKGILVKHPPILHVPVVDEVQDAVALSNSRSNTEKLKIPNGATICARVWISGMPDQFLNHVQNMLNYIKHKGLFEENMTTYK